jgi:hypothetical protein
LIEGSAEINIGHGPCEIVYDGTSGHYTFNVQIYLEDFEAAVERYVREVETIPAESKKVTAALATKPLLV